VSISKDFRVKNGLVVEQDANVTGSVTATSFIGSGTSLTGLYSTSTFSTDFATKDTDDLSEGSNQYFTDARARSAISATGSLSYNSTTGVISFTQGNSDTVSEGSTNLYYTDTRVNTYLTTNNYVTKAQAEADAVALAIALG